MLLRLGKLSRSRLEGSAPPLVRVVGRAIEFTTQDSGARKAGARVSYVVDPFNGHIDEFRIARVQRFDRCIETTWNNMSDPGAFTVAGAEEQEDGEPPPLAGAGVVVCLMA
jgi:hypothetical protein